MKYGNGLEILKDESGVLTLDFIFAFSLTFTLTLILLALSISLSTFEITQYVTYTVARTYAGAHGSEELQKEEAQKKFKQIAKDNEVIGSLYRNGWFEITGNDITVGDLNQDYNADVPKYVGARLELNAKVLEFRLPLLGNTFEDEDGFKSKFSSFILRSPSQQECLENFNKKRYAEIRRLNPEYNNAPQVQEAVISDNWC